MFGKRNKKILSNLLTSFLLLSIVILPFVVSAATKTEIAKPPCDSPLNPACWPEMLWKTVIRGMAETVLSLTSLVTWAAGSLLDVVIKITIVDMSKNIKDITGIDTAWTAMRDLANIFFIFILLYAAIATVLQLGGVNAKKIITRVIIIALLINFSMFFTRVIIDVSNALSVGFYNAIVSKVPIGTSGDPSISGKYMEKLLLTTLYKTDGSGKPAVDLGEYPAVGFLGAVFFLVAAFVFLAAAVLFISRYVVLIFLIILSAPAFAAMAMPNDKYSGRWWEALWSQVIFAPVFFILSWITLQVLDGVVKVVPSSGASLATAITGSIDSAGNQTADPGAVNIFANFGIAITFMIASLTIAKSLAGTAGKGIQSFVGGVVGGATVGAAAWAGRRFIGGAAQRTLEDDRLKDKAAKGDVGARLQLQAAAGLSKASFDVRNIKSGGIGGVISKDLGKGGGKGGYAEIEKRQLKAEEDRAKLLVPSDVAVDQAQRKADAAKTELPELKKQISEMENLREASDREFLNKGGEGEMRRLKKALLDSEKAQEEIDRLKGVSKKDAEKRGIEPVESAATTRQKKYAEQVEKGPFLVSYLMQGDRKTRAAKVRKLAKGKDAKQKASEVLKDLQEEGEIEGVTGEEKTETPPAASEGSQGTGKTE